MADQPNTPEPLDPESETVVVARDPETGRPRPLTDAERAALERANG